MAKPPGGHGGNDSNIIIEFRQVGHSVKVTAVDPVSLVEATIIGPASESQEALSRLAIQKLRYVLSKKAE